MTFEERFNLFTKMFEELQDTNSRTEKVNIIQKYLVDNSVRDDFYYIVECLNGEHKFGFTYANYYYSGKTNNVVTFETIKSCLQYLQEPVTTGNLSVDNITMHVRSTLEYRDFLQPIVDRELKLGIGKSLFEPKAYSPMLAKKFLDGVPEAKEYFVTEKLDGNRCIAFYDGIQWVFYSRNGKKMNVSFNMSNLPKTVIFDGEVLSKLQTYNSSLRYKACLGQVVDNFAPESFNATSGIINSKYENKNLVYNIFDIIDEEMSYSTRRSYLEYLSTFTDVNETDIRILPILYKCNSLIDLYDNIGQYHKIITDLKGEGCMINVGDAKYQHKRTNALLKLKNVKTIDMMVTDILPGRGKYEGCVGALNCLTETEDGKIIECSVGSGLTDLARVTWAVRQNEIIGKIVEIQYFELSQMASMKGTKYYSLRFPRFIKIRKDKESTSEF